MIQNTHVHITAGPGLLFRTTSDAIDSMYQRASHHTDRHSEVPTAAPSTYLFTMWREAVGKLDKQVGRHQKGGDRRINSQTSEEQACTH